MVDRTCIDATERSPEIELDFESNRFTIRGESFPEDAATFYQPIMEILEKYLSEVSGESITFSFELVYFNSSSAKILMELFNLLDRAASTGNDVNIVWIAEEDDDNMQELGTEFAEDLECAKFELQRIATD